MTVPGAAPVLDARDAEAFAAALRARVAASVPGWMPARGGPSAALLDVYARYLQVLAERIGGAPDKNKLAFLDALGLDLLTAQAARAPVVFRASATVGDTRAPAGTRLGASVPGSGEQLVFETEQELAVAAAELSEVATLWPGRDAWADHSADAAAGRPFTLFEPAAPIPHELYLAHDRHFAFAAGTSLELAVTVTRAGSEPLATTWEHWDGDAWRPFGTTVDGTDGLVRSGTIRLVAECGAGVDREVQGIRAHWIRARLATTLPPQAGRTLPEVGRILVRSVVDRTLPAGASCAAGVMPDTVMANGQPVDPSATFQPLGPAPGPGAALSFTSTDAFARPGARVTVCLDRPVTAAEKADKATDEWAKQVGTTKLALDQALVQAELVVTILSALAVGTDPLPAFPVADQTAFLTDLGARARRILDGVKTSAPRLAPLFSDGIIALVAAVAFGPLGIPAAAAAASAARTETARLASGLARAVQDLILDDPTDPIGAPIKIAADAIVTAADVGDINGILTAWPSFAGLMTVWTPRTIFDAGTPPFLVKAKNDYDALLKRITDSRAQLVNALKAANEVIRLLKTVDPAAVASQQGKARPSVDPPELAWEYFDGARWRPLPGLSGPATARNLGASGRVAFDVPEDWAESDAGGTRARWLRVRLAKGSFGRLVFVSWVDGETGELKYMSMVQPRPPELDALTLGYRDAPTPTAAERCLVHGDFRWGDRTEEATWPGRAFRPFEPTADRTPALYLGLSRALPAGRLGVLMDVEERPPADASTLEWEYFDEVWQPLRVDDGTRGLTEPGIVTVHWPGTLTPAAATPRFGTPLAWIRARLRHDAEPPRALVRLVRHNAAWAANVETVLGELIGSSSGQPRQTAFASRTPVLPGQVVEVRELEGPRAHVERPLLLADIVRGGGNGGDVRDVTDPRTGRIQEVWVRWRERPSLLFSGPADRHYTIERSRGRIAFGDGVSGRIPPAGRDNLRLARYRAGGGVAGNVPAGAIDQLLGGLPVEEVGNPWSADGGAAGEQTSQVLARGPRLVRHRRQALATGDYAALAYEASPAVAVAHAARIRPGAVLVRIAPWSTEARPQPSRELRRRVHDFVLARAPASLGGGVSVTGVEYVPVGIRAVVAVDDPDAGADIARRVAAAVRAFLHPLTGGDAGRGWSLGRGVRLSDIAGVVEVVPGVDQAVELTLVAGDAIAADMVDVPPGAAVAPGEIAVVTAQGEG